nr:transposase [Streptomyces sp. CB02058]
MDATPCVDRTGTPWRYLPHDFAPWETVRNRLRILCHLAEGWRLRPAQRTPPPTGPKGRRPRRRTHRLHPRHSERQDFSQRARHRSGHRRGQKDRRPRTAHRRRHRSSCR